jgi:glycine/D-amino acid oxidase-like deaminating enzyme
MDDERNKADECLDQMDRLNCLFEEVIGHSTIYREASDKITDFGFSGTCRMIYNPYEGQLNTGRMMRTLLSKVYDRDILVLNGCEIQEIKNESHFICLKTNQGSFKAAKVILATNAFASQLFPGLSVTPGRGQVLVTKPVDGLRIKGTYHFDDGYYYFRNIDGRVLFGGGRNLDLKAEETWEFGNTEAVKEKLVTYLKEVILPGQNFEIDCWWSGIMGFGEDISPIVKQVEPKVFCAVRCNGMGVAMGSLVGEEVAELALE